MSELKACPFCGNRNVVVDTCGSDEVLFVRCDVCHATGPAEDEDHLSETSIKWNARPIEDALASDLAALRKENASLHEANEIDLGEKAPLIFQITELRARLGEAEEAIRWMHGYDVPGAPMFPFSSEPGNRYAWRGISRELPGVQRALKGAS